MKRWTLIVAVFSLFFACQSGSGEYVCPPCDLPCDELTFDKPGICPHCQMTLIHRSELEQDHDHDLEVGHIHIDAGKGKFAIEGGADKDKIITVHYYRPSELTDSSDVIIVLPGAGRNGDDYRDAWVEKAEECNVLVLSPEYSDEHYPQFWNYNLAAMYTDVKVNSERTAIESFAVSPDTQWIFSDFDRLFDLVCEELRLETDHYDMFGHSAGGQILHRLALFAPDAHADQILAANSGWYTLPSDDADFPYGMNGVGRDASSINFNSRLVLFLGEKDDENETRGSLRRSPEADAQGLHRLARGHYFHQVAEQTATDLGTDFRWTLHIVPNVGHDYRKMGEAAADYLYKKKDN